MPLGPMIRQLSPGPKLRLMSLSRRRLPSGVYTSTCLNMTPSEASTGTSAPQFNCTTSFGQQQPMAFA